MHWDEIYPSMAQDNRSALPLHVLDVRAAHIDHLQFCHRAYKACQLCVTYEFVTTYANLACVAIDRRSSYELELEHKPFG